MRRVTIFVGRGDGNCQSEPLGAPTCREIRGKMPLARPLHVPRPMTRSRADRGFTLVELMVVVTIIAILAFLAVVGYRKLVTSSHTAEATEMINSIKVAQETYHAETGQYANISNGLGLGNLYPRANADPGIATGWGADCSWCADPQGWRRLPVHANGPVRFGYATMAGPLGANLPAPPVSTITFPAASDMTSDWFVVSAMGDMDGNGVYCTAVGTSWQKEIFIDKDGE